MMSAAGTANPEQPDNQAERDGCEENQTHEDLESLAAEIVDTVPQPLLILNADLCVHSANRAFYHAFRVCPEATEHRHVCELGNGQWNISALRTLLQNIIPGRMEFEDFEVDHSFPTIGRRFMVLSARRLRSDKHPGLIVLAIQDVTAERSAQEQEARFTQELQRSYSALQETERQRDDLTNMIVHDLRTPLTSVIAGMLSLDEGPKDEGSLDEFQREMVGISIEGARTLLGIINDLLEVHQMEAGTLILNYAELDADVLVTSAEAQVASLRDGKDLTIVRRIAEGLPAFRGDEDKLRRVLVNLLGNAIKFTPAGGAVTVGAELSQDRHAVVFTIADTGEGIPEAAFGQIFEKFGQVESRRAGRRMSSGLGLTFCKLAIEAHGGTIGVRSVSGMGSTFYFEIPLRVPIRAASRAA